MLITSNQNPKIKNLIKLIKKSRERKKKNYFVVEGKKENQLAIKNCFRPVEFFICPSIYQSDINPDKATYKVSKSLYQKIAFRTTTEGIIGIYETPVMNHSVFLSKNPTILILESIEKPGNLGAIFRNCDAFSVDLLIICDTKTDIFNPNVIRSSIGCIFTITICIMSKEECLEFCLKNKFKIFTTFINENSISLNCVDFNCSSAIVFGTEHQGIHPFWKKYSNENFNIPMHGQIDSLNVSNSIAITLYEILRQKLFKINIL